WIAETWAETNKAIFRLMLPTVWDIRCDTPLYSDHSYLVISNHQSWVDIAALVQSFNRKAPYFKFFLKKELIWVPFLGLAFWALLPLHEALQQGLPGQASGNERQGPGNHPGRLREVQAHAGDRGELPRRHPLHPRQARQPALALSAPAETHGRRRRLRPRSPRPAAGRHPRRHPGLSGPGRARLLGAAVRPGPAGDRGYPDPPAGPGPV